ncbi:MAG: GPW/gp25 family protein [Rikenellaceae bacterium]|nr:GPW/gp25 family protein [Rikenellaceae bacterium]
MDDGKSHLGRGWAFPPGFTKGFGADMAAGEEDIRQSLRILLSTRPGERWMQPDYGCDLSAWVFMEADLTNRTLLADTVRRSVVRYEPRIELDKVEVDTDDVTEGVWYIRLEYRVKETNSRGNMVYPFYFREGTNL